MTPEELTFQYWQDGQGAWQWQLIVHATMPEDVDSELARATDGVHWVIASGTPSLSKEETLADIEMVKGSKSASVVQSSPVDLATPGGF